MPAWLPEFCETNGEWDEVVSALYRLFCRDFVESPLNLEGDPIWRDRRITEKYEEAFWHLITRTDDRTGERLFDPRRAERLSWCAAIIRNSTDPAVKQWQYREGTGKIRRYLWLEAYDYVVVLERRKIGGNFVNFLISAHHVDGESRRRSLKRKYEKREQP